MNILTVVVLAVFLLFAANGLRKGLVKKLAGIVALLISSILVSVALPYITDFLKEQTPVYEYIVGQCETVVSKQAASSVLGNSKQGNGQGSKDSSLDREQILNLVDQYGYQYGVDRSMAENLSDAQLQELAGSYLQSYINQSLEKESGLQDDESSGNLLSMTRVEQTQLIQNLPIPDFLKNLMLNYNNSEGYKKLNVNDFAGYTVQFFANIILNIIAFIVTLVVVQLMIWTVITALDIFSRLPIIHLINRLGGLAIGILQGLFAVWMFFLVIAIFSGTEIGMMLMNMIDQSTILKPMYESNMFLKIIVQAISNIL